MSLAQPWLALRRWIRDDPHDPPPGRTHVFFRFFHGTMDSYHWFFHGTMMVRWMVRYGVYENDLIFVNFARKLISGRKWCRFDNIGYRDPFPMICAPLESPDCQLSIGISIMENGFLYRKLWTTRTLTILDPGIFVFSCNFLGIN